MPITNQLLSRYFSNGALDPFRHLPQAIREEILEKGLIEEFNSSDTILFPGDPGTSIRFLISGKASVIINEDEGRKFTVDVLTPGDVIGEVSFLSGKPSPANSEVIADEKCSTFEIASSNLEPIIRNNPEFALELLKLLANKIIKLDDRLSKNVRKKRALQALISQQDHLFPDYFVSETVRRRTGKKLEELAAEHRPILITGETGVGKEFLAHALFGMSSHHKRVFLFLDLARSHHQTEPGLDFCELPDAVCDPTEDQSALFFGSEHRGSGGLTETPGYLELTEEGTLLVKGLEQLTPAIQLKLLKTLNTGIFRRTGGKSDLTSDFRLIGTTNLDVSEISPDKHPLLHSLLEHSLDIPPLRKRRKEIPALVNHYASKYSQELHKDVRTIPKETMKALVSYSWPGNDRELATTLKRAVLLSEDGIIRPQDIYFDLRKVEGLGKVNLLRIPALKAAIRSPLFPAIFQSAAAPFFFILLILLFLGPADPKSNAGGLFSWAIGWPTMIFGAFFWARFWCSLCPMGTLSHLAKKIISWDLPLPIFIKQKSDWIIAASALFIIWIETATDIRNSPLNTGILLLTIFGMALVTSIIFEKQSWCRYLCPLGGMMGVLAKTSPFELRAERAVCASQCTSNECYTGTAEREGCPFGQLVPTLRSNRFCKMCGTCVKNCPHGAVHLNLRVPGREIWEIKQVAAITAILVISMFGGLMSELFQKTVLFQRWTNLIPFHGEMLRFTVFFLLMLGAVNLLVFLSSYASSKSTGETPRENFAKYGLALLPLVLTFYMAYHLYYLINLGVYFPIMLWQVFQFDLFKQLVITVPPSVTLRIQEFFILLGVVGSLVITYRLSKGKNKSWGEMALEFVPHAIIICVFSYAAVSGIRQFFY